jgi:hypothetical protein
VESDIIIRKQCDQFSEQYLAIQRSRLSNHLPDSKTQRVMAQGAALEEIAKSEDIVPSYATRPFRFTVLAPDIVSAILSGKHPAELTPRRLMDDTRLPLAWDEQRRRLGFESAY